MGIAIDIVPEAPLARIQRRTPETRMGIEYRQKRQGYARIRAGRCHSSCHLRRVGIGFARRLMMEIVKFADTGKAALQHLDKSHGGDRFHGGRIDRTDQLVHAIAPTPEIILFTAARLLRAPGHRPLKGMAMEIGQTWQRHGMALVLSDRANIGRNSADPAAGQTDPHVAGPAVGKQRLFKPQIVHANFLQRRWTINGIRVFV